MQPHDESGGGARRSPAGDSNRGDMSASRWRRTHIEYNGEGVPCRVSSLAHQHNVLSPAMYKTRRDGSVRPVVVRFMLR